MYSYTQYNYITIKSYLKENYYKNEGFIEHNDIIFEARNI